MPKRGRHSQLINWWKLIDSSSRVATHETFGTCLVPSVLGKSIVTKQLTIEFIKKGMIYVSIFFSVNIFLAKIIIIFHSPNFLMSKIRKMYFYLRWLIFCLIKIIRNTHYRIRLLMMPSDTNMPSWVRLR